MAHPRQTREGRHRLSVAHLLTALVALFVVAPAVDAWRYGEVVESFVFSLVLLVAINAVGGRRRTQLTAAILAAPALATSWYYHIRPDALVIAFSLLTTIVFVTFVVWHLFRFVVSAPQVNAEVLCAAISIYILFAVAWASLYELLAQWDPGAFAFTGPTGETDSLAGFTALYYSMQVFTTITFGDILPVSNAARVLSIVQAGLGVFYMAILVARLVGLYASKPSMK